MFAKVVLATVEPRCVDDATRAVAEELILAFVAHPGARVTRFAKRVELRAGASE